MATHSSIHDQGIPGQRGLVGCCPQGSTESDTTEAIQHVCICWRRKWQPTPVFLPGESHGQKSLVGCHPWGHTDSGMTEATQQQQHNLGVYLKLDLFLIIFLNRSRERKELKSKGTNLLQKERSWLTLPTHINLYSCGLGGSIQRSQQINFNSHFETLAVGIPNNLLRNMCDIYLPLQNQASGFPKLTQSFKQVSI